MKKIIKFYLLNIIFLNLINSKPIKTVTTITYHNDKEDEIYINNNCDAKDVKITYKRKLSKSSPNLHTCKKYNTFRPKFCSSNENECNYSFPRFSAGIGCGILTYDWPGYWYGRNNCYGYGCRNYGFGFGGYIGHGFGGYGRC